MPEVARLHAQVVQNTPKRLVGRVAGGGEQKKETFKLFGPNHLLQQTGHANSGFSWFRVVPA